MASHFGWQGLAWMHQAVSHFARSLCGRVFYICDSLAKNRALGLWPTSLVDSLSGVFLLAMASGNSACREQEGMECSLKPSKAANATPRLPHMKAVHNNQKLHDSLPTNRSTIPRFMPLQLKSM